LRESEQRYRDMVEGASELIYRTDADGFFTHFNAAAIRVLAGAAVDLLGRHHLELVRPDRRDAARAFYRRQQEDRLEATYCENPITTDDGRELWLGQSVRLVIANGQIVAWEGIARDITDRKRAEHALESERRLLRAVLDGVDAGIVACDASGKLTLFNRAAREWLGVPPECDPAQGPEHYALFRADGKTPLPPQEAPRFRSLEGEEVRDFEMTVVPEGRPALRVLASSRPIVDESGRGRGAVVTFTDITRLRRAQEEIATQREALYQSEKLACMGTLLAGVAHELNNPLSVALASATLLRRQFRGDESAALRAEAIEKAVDRCGRIVANFLALARQRPAERRKASLNQIVEEALELVTYPLRVAGVDFELDAAPDLPALYVDPHQIHQVVINLTTNAMHAMKESPNPRRLTVRTRCDRGAGRALLEVADTGPGMTPDVRARIFEQFFTTKPAGQGTGLGLPLCQGIVTSHGGLIEVESERGRGALFRVILPLTGTALIDARGRVSSPQVSPRAILVIDDEPDVGHVLADVLRLDGHQVDVALDGVDGIAHLAARQYDLILSDVRMPGIDGTRVLQEAARLDPTVRGRFIFVTGDDFAVEMPSVRQSGARVVRKPFGLDEIRRAIADTLGGAAAS